MKFSIIIPCYNCAAFITRTLEAVKAQTYTNYEVQLVDDGSQDNTSEVINKYIGDNPTMEIHLTKQENRGIGSARNMACRQSTGDTLAFLDNDDIWYPAKLERTALYLGAHPDIDLVSHRIYKRYPDGTKRVLPTAKPQKDPFQSLLLKGNTLAVSATSVRREAYEKVGGSSDLHGGEDYDLWLKLAVSGASFGFIEQYLGEMTRRPESYSAAGLEQVLDNVLGVIDKYGEIMLAQNPGDTDRIKRKVRARKASETASAIVKLGRRKDFAAARRQLTNLLNLIFHG